MTTWPSLCFCCLNRDNGIGSDRHRRTGCDPRRRSKIDVQILHVAGRLATDDFSPRRWIVGNYGKAVNRRCPKGGLIFGRHDVVGQYPAEYIIEGYVIGLQLMHFGKYYRSRLLRGKKPILV